MIPSFWGRIPIARILDYYVLWVWAIVRWRTERGWWTWG